ncbi:MAG: hypothetical protein V4808_05840 [Pseudomonadota bacterium]
MIGQEDAAGALASVERTRRRAGELRGYAHGGDIVLAWGLVWLVCNLATQFAPLWGHQTWPFGVTAAVIFSMIRGRASGKGDWRVFATTCTALGLLALVSLVTEVKGSDEANVLISLFVAAAYVAAGIWSGARYAWAGLAIAAFASAGWFVDREHLNLWLGLGGGGAFILTGLWMRRA